MEQKHTSTTYQLSETGRHIPVDTEHFGIRLLMPSLLFIGLIGGYVLGNVTSRSIAPSVGPLCISTIFAVIGAVILLTIGEQIIKPLWTSGRHIEADTHQLVLHDRRRDRAPQTTIEWQQPLNVTAYYWEVNTGKSRVRKGWYCVVLQLEQNDSPVLIYTFLPPESMQTVPRLKEWFVRLLPKAQRENLAKDDPREAARQERYRKLESHRWFDGAEIAEPEFMAIMEMAAQYGSVQR